MPNQTSTTQSTLSVWRLVGDLLTSQSIVGQVALTGALDPVDAGSPATPRLVPLAGEGGALAAILVPPEAEGAVLCDGGALCPGLHLIRHADQLEVDGQTFWVAASVSADVTTYDPAIHGDDVYCFVTKVRLHPGDEIVSCPGRPGVPCGIIYRRAAWEMALESDPRFRCPGCRFDPSEGVWKPSVPEISSLKSFLEKARRAHGGPSEN